MPVDHSPGASASASDASQASEIAAWRRRRSVIKASCTRIETFVNNLREIDPESIAQLEERRVRLDAWWIEYDALQAKIELYNEQDNDREGFEEMFCNLCARIRFRTQVTPAPTTMQAPIARSISTASADSAVHVRLPKLNLPSFSGKYEEWFPFHDTFNSIIHVNNSLSNIQKLQYLRASLNDQALDIIKPLEISERNYDLAWQLLEERYDNKRVIVQSHIKSIMDLPSATKENTNELRAIADGVSRHIRALTALGRPADKWDDLLVHVVCAKLDPITSREWHTSWTGTELPTLKNLLDFVAQRSQMLETISVESVETSARIKTRSQGISKRQAAHAATIRCKCNYCENEHSIYVCKKFLSLPVEQRIAEARRRKLCLNCLRGSGHVAAKCTSGYCKICNSKHNTLLHVSSGGESGTDAARANKPRPTEGPSDSNQSAAVAYSAIKQSERDVLLSTAIIHVYDKNHARRSCRALLDSGSQANFVSEGFLRVIRLKTRSVNISVSGIGGASSASTKMVSLRIRSRTNAFVATIDCIVTDRITSKLPSNTIKRGTFELPVGIELADPQFNISSEIDMLIGAELFWRLLCVGQISATAEHPTIQKTCLGWVLAGRATGHARAGCEMRALHTSISNAELHERVNVFWRSEEIAREGNDYTAEEQACETTFAKTVATDPQGRYIVKLPVKQDVFRLIGETREVALKRFHNLEKRLQRDANLRDSYARFLNEYESLGHMKAVRSDDVGEEVAVYLPHHGVFKGREAKLRVVFDASCKSNTGISLNDALMVGPVTQQDLVSILARFRTFAYAFSADIVKMYRQILVDESQTRLQRIFWRDNPNSPVGTYELSTVTYGMSSASFLATRCIRHLAEKYAAEYPIGSKCALRDFYVDDLLTGANTLAEAKRICDEIAKLLRRGQFELSKWTSNCRELLENEGNAFQGKSINKVDGSKVLGIIWEPTIDEFRFKYNYALDDDRVTKRAILSNVASLFDPLGLLGPIIVQAKAILQDIWQARIDWDESLPQDIHDRWLRLKRQLTCINEIRVPRCVNFDDDRSRVQVHGFCDASERAYGACIYIRSQIAVDRFVVRLLISKSRIAPVRATTIPRLELCAALLLAELIEKLRSSVDLSGTRVVLWTDSMVALQWISSPSRRWVTFVANRVGEIQRLTEGSDWRHVPTSDNPADVVSRGISPSELADHSMWWCGPSFLGDVEARWPCREISEGPEPPERRRTVVAAAATTEVSVLAQILEKYSNLDKILRIFAYCLRFGRARRAEPRDGFVSHEEMTRALQVLVRNVQREAFPEEHKTLKQGRAISAASSILALTPFLDGDGLVRVGGRLKNSALSYDARHPILLPKSHRLTKLIIEREHIRNLHSGLQSTINATRQRFWPLAARSTTRAIIRKCVACFRTKPISSEALMADLPERRVTMSRPFSHAGVDYAGPISLKEGKRRNARMHKAYIAIFVCFATRAVHIEIVTDLTTEAFLGALKRFIARRGKPVCIYSDNGTTFVGAQKQLSEFFDFVRGEDAQRAVREMLRGSEISWNFIPPNAPHFGGLWEAAVKSAKLHMRKIVGNAHLTLEEAQTVLCEIEAILNSRPLSPLSTDANDLACLTPGHFLIGAELNSFPVPDITEENEGRLVRWQRVEQLRQHFWRRWNAEYLQTLINRQKWKADKGERLEVGRLALIQQQGLGPLQWVLGRVEQVHPGKDGVARVATLRTGRGSVTRPLSRLAILPIEGGKQT